MAKKPCPPDIKEKILNEYRETLTGLDPQEIENLVEAMSLKLDGKFNYNEIGVVNKLTVEEQNELAQLRKELISGLQKRKKKNVESILGDKYERFKELHYRESAGGRERVVSEQEKPKTRRSQVAALQDQIEVLESAGETEKAEGVRRVLEILKRIENKNNIAGRNNQKIREIKERYDIIESEISQVREALNQSVFDATGQEEISLIEARDSKQQSLSNTGRRIEKVKEAITRAKKDGNKEALAKLKKERDQLSSKARKEAKELLKAEELLKDFNKRKEASKRGNTANAYLQTLEMESLKLARELSKYGSSNGYIFHRLIENGPATAREISNALKTAKEKIDARRKIIDELMEHRKSEGLDTMLVVDLATILGPRFVLSRADNKSELSFEETDKLFREYRKRAMAHAALTNQFISDTEFADRRSLKALEDLFNCIDASTVIDGHDPQPLVEGSTMEERVERSTPGVTSERWNKEVNTGRQLFNVLRLFAGRINTLRSLPNFGKYVDIDYIWAILLDIPELRDRHPMQMFPDAARYSTVNETMDKPEDQDIKSAARAVLSELGISDDILLGREFTDFEGWKYEARIVSFDIETFVGGEEGIHTIGLTVNGERRLMYAADQRFSPEELMNVLQEIESLQNNNHILTTFNGSGFDLLQMAKAIGTEEAYKLAARIALRSVDIMHNVASWEASNMAGGGTGKNFSLANVSEAVGATMAGKVESYWASLWFLRSKGITVTVDDLSKVAISDAEKKIIVDDANNYTPEEARISLENYITGDIDSTAIVFSNLEKVARGTATLNIKDKHGTSFILPANLMQPNWNMDTRYSSFFGGFRQAMSDWKFSSETGRRMFDQYSALVPDGSYGRVEFDLDKVMGRIVSMMTATMVLDPKSRILGRTIASIAQTDMTPDEKIASSFIGLITNLQESSTEVNKKMFADSGNRLPLKLQTYAEGGDRLPTFNYAEGTVEEQENLYIASMVQAMKDQIKLSRLTVEDISKSIGYEGVVTDGNDNSYAELAKFIVTKYTRHRNFSLADFGNGNLDFAPAQNVGRGLIQAVTDQRQGFKKSLNRERTFQENVDVVENPEEIEKSIENPLNETFLTRIFRHPNQHEVNNIIPISVADIQTAIWDFKLRERIKHILSYEFKTNEEAQEVIKQYQDLVADVEEVLGETKTEVLKLLPNVNNAVLGNKVDSIDEIRERIVEALLDLPQMLFLWQHDSVTSGENEKMFWDESTQKTYVDDALSPGSFNSIGLISTMGPQFAWSLSYFQSDDPVKQRVFYEKLFLKSLERGRALFEKNKDVYSVSNYRDYNMNGVHHAAALHLAYSKDRESRILNLLLELNNDKITGEIQDRYNKIGESIIENQDAIRETLSRLGDKRKLEQFDAIVDFIKMDNANTFREIMKGAAIPRNYLSGVQGIKRGIREKIKELDIAVPFDVNFLSEMLVNESNVINMFLLDSALSTITYQERIQLANKIAAEMSDVYSNATWFRELKNIAAKTGASTESWFAGSQIRDLIEERILWESKVTGKSVEAVKEKYKSRVEKAEEYVRKVRKEAGISGKVDIRSSEHMRNLNIILLGDEFAYKNLPTLRAINAMNRVSFRMNMDAFMRQASMLPFHIDPADSLGFELYNIYFSFGHDTFGERFYPTGMNGVIPINSSFASVVRYLTQGGKNDNPNAMWELKDNMLYNMSREEAIAEIDKIMAKNIALQFAREHMPKFGDYVGESQESLSKFLSDWKERSSLEDQAFIRAERDSVRLTDKERAELKKNGGYVGMIMRAILNENNTRNSTFDTTYLPGVERSVKGFAALRPEYASMRWEDRGIFSLMEIHYNRRLENARQYRASIKDEDPKSVNDILPPSSAGYVNPFENSPTPMPHVYETPFDFIHEMTYGDSNSSVERRATHLRNRLQEFARINGFDSLLPETGSGDYARIYTIMEIQRKVLDKFVKKIMKIIDSPNAYEEMLMARMEMLSDLTERFEFHQNVSQQEVLIQDLGNMIGIKGSDVAGMLYIDVFKYLKNRGVDPLSKISLGLSPMNTLKTDPDTPTGKERPAPATMAQKIQGVEAFQVITNILYSEVGRQYATKFLKEKLTPEEFDALEKDRNGFVTLSSIPMQYQNHIALWLYSPQGGLNNFDITREIPLYIFMDEVTGETYIHTESEESIARRIDYSPMAQPVRIAMGSFNMNNKTNGKAQYHLTPEDLSQMLTALRNVSFFERIALAGATRSDIGMTVTPEMRMVSAEKSRFYEAQRIMYGNEMDLLSFLHNESGNKLETTISTKRRDEFGMPLVVYDATYYTGGEKYGNVPALVEAYAGYVNQAIMMARKYGLEEEAENLVNFIKDNVKNKDGDFNLIPAMIIVASAYDKPISHQLKLLTGYFGAGVSDEYIRSLHTKVSKIASTYLMVTSRTEPRNPFFHQAKRMVEILGTVNVMNTNLSENFIGYDGSPEHDSLIRKAVERANQLYMFDRGRRSSPGEASSNASESLFVNPEYQTLLDPNSRNTINNAIVEMVENNVISEETAGMFRSMIAIIADKNDAFLDGLSIQLDPNLETEGESQRYDNRFVIKLNPRLLKERAVPEIIEVFAHEITHIARLKYIKTGGDSWRKLTAFFRDPSAQETMHSMVSAMYSGDKFEINSLIQHFKSNPEEFLAEWGAFVLIAEATKESNRKLRDKYTKASESSMAAQEATSWWKRAFARVKKLAQTITIGMNEFRSKHPKIMKLMDDVVEEMFNFDGSFDRSRPHVVAESGSFQYPRRFFEKGTGILDVNKLMSLYYDFQVRDELGRLSIQLDPTKQKILDDVEKRLAAVEGRRNLLGQDIQEYSQAISEMYDIMNENPENRRLSPQNRSQRIALANLVLEKVAEQRGERVGGSEAEDAIRTVGDKASELFKHALDVLYNGTSRTPGKKGLWGTSGIGGGNDSGLTYASSETILAALGYLLDSSKGSAQNVFTTQNQGIISRWSAIRQEINTASLMVHSIKGRWGKDSNKVLFGAIEYLQLNRSDQAIKRSKTNLTDEMWEHAKELANQYAAVIDLWMSGAKETGILSKDSLAPNDRMAFMLRSKALERAGQDSTTQFVSALQKAYEHRIQNQLHPTGSIDSFGFYLSNLFPQFGYEKEFFIQHFENRKRVQNGEQIEDFDAQVAVVNTILKMARRKFIKNVRRRDRTVTEKDAGARFDRNITDILEWRVVGESIEFATKQLMRQIHSGTTYNVLFSDESARIMDIISAISRSNSRKLNSAKADDIIDRKFYNDLFNTKVRFKPNPLWMKDSRRPKTISDLHTTMLLKEMGNNAYLPNANAFHLSFTDMMNTPTLTESEKAILSSGFEQDLSQVILGVSKTLGRKYIGRLSVMDITGVTGIEFSDVIDAIKESKNGDEAWTNALDAIQRKHDLAIGAAAVFDDTADNGMWGLIARAGKASTDVIWGGNQGAATLIFEGFLGSVTDIMYGQNPLLLWKDVLSNIANLFVGVYGGRGYLNNQNFNADLGALFDMENIMSEVMDPSFTNYATVDSDETGKLARFQNWWWRKLRQGHRVAPVAVRNSLKLQGQRLIFQRLSLLDKYRKALENYKGPHNLKKFKKILREVGSVRNLDLWGTESSVLLKMSEAGVFKSERTITAIKFLFDNFRKKNGLIDYVELQKQLAFIIKERGVDGIVAPNITVKDLKDAMVVVNKFQEKYAEDTMVVSHPMDRPTGSHPASFLFNLYRSFPKLFMAQHVLDKYQRLTNRQFVTHLLSAFALDIIYNVALMYASGAIDDDMLERIRKGDVTTRDVQMIVAIVLRNPIISNRMLTNIAVQGTNLLAFQMLGNRPGMPSFPQLGMLLLPPSAIAAISAIYKSGKPVADAIKGDFDTASFVNHFSKLVPGVGLLTRTALNELIEEEKKSTTRGGRSASATSTFISNMDSQDYSDKQLLKDVLKEFFPNALDNIPPTRGMALPVEVMSNLDRFREATKPKAPQTPPATQSPAQAAPVAPTQAPAPSGPRATNPATPPPELGGP